MTSRLPKSRFPKSLRSLAATAASVPITLFGLVLITFLIGRVVPIDPVLAIIGDRAPEDVVARTRIELCLDQPLPAQFLRYLGSLASGDLGRSVQTGNPVTTDIARFFPATLELATAALLIATLIGVPLGVWAAVRQGTWIDQAIRVVCLSGHSVPVFVLALLALLAERPAQASMRNLWPGTVTGLELLADRVRVQVEGQRSALVDVTPAAVSELGLQPGATVWLAAKATEAEAYPAPAP